MSAGAWAYRPRRSAPAFEGGRGAFWAALPRRSGNDQSDLKHTDHAHALRYLSAGSLADHAQRLKIIDVLTPANAKLLFCDK
ncbi:hypothetical protein RT94_17260 [Pseudomonas viridiflava]|nr:hypothetical protein RT94_17260 [Pseudomonas viridiflava]